jgi:hypothetical protein
MVAFMIGITLKLVTHEATMVTPPFCISNSPATKVVPPQPISKQIQKRQQCFSYTADCIAKEMKRKLWVHPILKDQTMKGRFYSLYSQLREDDNKFFNYLRMSKKYFDELLRVLEKQLRGYDTNTRQYTTLEEKLVTLR